MKEQLYTIPVNDAFDQDCECPICEMYRSLETAAIEFTMGPSYMEDDIRMETDRLGFCAGHVRMLYGNQNRLGLALMLLTHMDRTIKEAEKSGKGTKITGGGLFRKKEGTSPVKQLFDQLEGSCYICSRMNGMFQRYLVTVFYLYHTEEGFRKKFAASKGFCSKHYALLYDMASSQLHGGEVETFLSELNRLYLENMKRVREDLEWFTDKFDYRNVDQPWKNSKDALPRAIEKLNSVHIDED